MSYILVVDDEPDIRGLVKDILEDEGHQVATAENGIAAKKLLRDRRPELVFLDIWMPDLDGISLLKEWSEGDGLPCPVIMMSGHGTVETAVEATRLGAYDFLEKPLSLAKLLLTAEHALQAQKLESENRGLKKRVDHIPEPVGHSMSTQHLREQVKRLAQHDTWVLISGEPGTGRETFARYMHSQSKRNSYPFVDVSVSSIAAGNSARELFGSEDGDKVVYGRLEQASGGTLFLDEVANMELEAQSQLLGALDTGSFVRVGGSEPVDVDVRIIAATSKNLEEQVRLGVFNEDLFFHLNVVPLHIAPLREHREDVPELLNYYADFFVSKEKLPYRKFSMAAQNYLRNYDWPGNIRELKNVVQRMMILSSEEEISQGEVESAVSNAAEPEINLGGAVVSFDQPIRQAREAFERAYLEYQLEKHKGNVSQMAEEAGMERTHLYRKLRSVGIEIKDRR